MVRRANEFKRVLAGRRCDAAEVNDKAPSKETGLPNLIHGVSLPEHI